MDLSFSFERARAAPQAAAAADARLLLGALAAQQASRPTAALAARIGATPPPPADARRALVALFSGEGDWSAAALMLGGSFHPRVAAAAAGKAGSTLMKPGFTFAF